MDKKAAKQQRIENILLNLKRFDYLTRAQLQRIHNLKGERNANRVLNSMDEYLNKFRHGMEYVYCLNKAGRERVQCDVIRKKTPNIDHFLLRNQLWIHLKYPSTWENEIRINVGDQSIVCDAKFMAKGGIPVFVEADVTQPMIKNKQKADRYRKIKAMSADPFHVVWITQLDSRRAKLNELMEGLTGRVYTLNEIN
jgi:hypothetical protein